MNNNEASTDIAAAPEIDSIEILELLGKGGMSLVYKARQKQLDGTRVGRRLRFQIYVCDPGLGCLQVATATLTFMTPPDLSESGAPPEPNLDLLGLCCDPAARRFHKLFL